MYARLAIGTAPLAPDDHRTMVVVRGLGRAFLCLSVCLSIDDHVRHPADPRVPLHLEGTPSPLPPLSVEVIVPALAASATPSNRQLLLAAALTLASSGYGFTCPPCDTHTAGSGKRVEPSRVIKN